MRPYSSVKTIGGLSYPSFSLFSEFRHGASQEDCAQKAHINSTVTQKVIKSVRLHILHQMKPY